MITIEAGLATLAQQRPIFHSEADFKHAFAWQLQQQDPTARIRLEYRPLPQVPLHLDLWIELSGRAIAIELKYPTRHIVCDHDGEHFSVYDHAAQPPHRYDFVKDIERLERVVSAQSQVVGYC